MADRAHDPPFPVVGVGASAGGLDALTRLIGAIPARPGLALVVILHLDPHHESQLTKILGAQSALPVVDAIDGTPIQPNHVYVIQPNTDVASLDGSLRVTRRPDDRRPHYPIDHFFRSLAAADGRRAVGVILSGTGSDGTLGLCEIKAAGGVTFAQDEHTAQHPGMPQSAVASGSVDLILAPEDIGRRLADLPLHPYLRDESTESSSMPAAPEEEFQRVISALRSSSGVDFSQYRDTTIKRRTARRMLLRGFTSPAEYAKFVERDIVEAEALYRDVLINVTSFFRDPEMFDELKRSVLPSIVKDKPESQSIRVWVPGCSSGQEAYSIAMVLLEFLGDSNTKRDIQIFATDLGDPMTLERARAGIYPESIESEVSPERLRRFFTREDRGYRIQKGVRDLCVFARQNITVDPPFSRVDLVTCRNVLIYMSTALQERLVPVFHFALNQKGFLVLGVAETVGPYGDLFELVSRSHKIYRRKDSVHRPQLTFMADEWLAGVAPRRGAGADSQPPDFVREADRVLLGFYAPPAVLVNADFEVQQFRGRTAPFLEPPAGQPTTSLLRLVREGLFMELRSALNEAKAAKAAVVRERLRLSDLSGDVEFTLRVVPVVAPQTEEAHYLVVFETTEFPPPPPVAAGAQDQATADREMAWLRQELTSNKHYVQSVLDAHDASNQELRAAHEEVLSSNEELQSTNEELETTKEELQSANEELTTVNEQFQRRNRELDALADDLSNFISSADVPLLTIGRDLSIRRSTPAAQRAFNVLPTDIGRSIEHIKFALDVNDIADVIETVIGTMQPMDRELTDREGRWWVLRVRPYLTADNRIDGATLVAFDIDSVKRNRELAESRDSAHAIVQTVREPIVVLDAECRVILANEAFYRLFGEAHPEIAGRPLWETGQGVWADLSVRHTLLGACQGKETIANREIQRFIPPRGLRTLILNARTISRDARAALLLLSVDDVTETRQAERLRIDAETLRLLDRRKDEFLGTLAHELRNPLAPMRFALDLMRRVDQTPAQAAHAHQVLERQVRHMVRIVDDLLDVSRITQGKIELRKERLLLSDVVRAAVELSRPAVDAARHTLTVSLPPEAVTLNGDSVRLTQVIVNLLNNAVKFTPPAGHIWLIAETLEGSEESHDHVRIRVRDTGIGIRPDVRGLVFDMFMQGDRSLERTRDGLGVGLTLVSNLVALHGGTVEARSEGEGQGSEFVVSLPIEPRAQGPDAGVARETARPSRSLRIIVADDNEDGREMLKYLLTHEGHIVEAAEDGFRAAELATVFNPDVAILDIGMPGLNGYETARRILDASTGRRPLLVALSGLGQVEDKTRALEAGFDHHFTKPADLDVLLATLAEALN